MRVVAIVNGYTGALCLQELVDQGDEVVGVVTMDYPAPGTPPESSVKLTADRRYLPVYQPPQGNVNAPPFMDVLRRLAPDLIVSMHYPVIFKEALLDIPPLGVVNEHPSRLPAGRGMTPSFWHMLIGDTRNWISLHYLDPGIDTGDVIAQGSIEIAPDDTGETTGHKLSEEGHRLFAAYLPLIRAGRAPRTPQAQIAGVTSSYYSWQAHYARVPWARSSEEVALHVRTLSRPRGQSTGWANCAYTYLAGRRIWVRRAVPLTGTRWDGGPAEPGEIVALLGEGLLVQTGAGLVLVTDADPADDEVRGLAGVIEMAGGGRPAVLR